MPEPGIGNQESGRLSRRALLRSAALGGAGLLGAYLLGCGGEEGAPAPTATGIAPSPTTLGMATFTSPTMRWRRLSPPAEPPPEPNGLSIRLVPPERHDHSLVSDGQRLYLFGGRGASGALGDLWSYDRVADNWAQLDAPGGPPARFGHNAVWDASRGRMLIFGGQDGGAFFNDLWEFDPAATQWTTPAASRWTQLTPVGGAPTPRYGAGAAFDGAGHLLVTQGCTSEGRSDDTWQYDLAGQTWLDLSPRQGDDRPVARCLMRAVWDSLKLRLLMFGGQAGETPFLGDLWAWSATRGWYEMGRTPAPSPRTSYAMVFDDQRAEAILFGGQTEGGPLNDLWVFHSSGENWTQPAVEGEAPAPRFGHDAALLMPGGPLLVFGGSDGSTEFNDLWELSVAT